MFLFGRRSVFPDEHDLRVEELQKIQEVVYAEGLVTALKLAYPRLLYLQSGGDVVLSHPACLPHRSEFAHYNRASFVPLGQ